MTSISEKIHVIDSASMRASNTSLLLNMIWREQEISRADMAERTGLSPSTVSLIVRDLENAGLVRVLGTGTSRGGRRPVLLGFCDDVLSIIGIELGAKHVTVVVTNLRGRILSSREEPYPVRDDPEGTLALCGKLINRCLAAERTALGSVIGIGIAVPSPVNLSAPGRLSPIIIPAWRNYDLDAWFTKRFGLPVFIDNDANLGALAEHWWGSGQSDDNLSYIKIGMGVGSGHVIRGEVYRGAGGSAGEIGHIALDPTGPVCRCGLRGCLGMFIGSQALINRAHERMALGVDTAISVSQIIAHAYQGNAAARAIIHEAGMYLGLALAAVINLMNPASIILGGELSKAGDLLIAPLRESIRQHALSESISETRIAVSELGAHSIAVGAATLVLQAALRDRSLFPTAQIARTAT